MYIVLIGVFKYQWILENVLGKGAYFHCPCIFTLFLMFMSCPIVIFHIHLYTHFRRPYGGRNTREGNGLHSYVGKMCMDWLQALTKVT